MFKKVLVPLDGSELAECALEHAKNLFKEDSIVEITILNVVNMDVLWAGLDGAGLDLYKMKDTRLASSRQYLDDVASRLGSEGIKVKTEVLEGDRAAGTIFDYAQKKGMDLIIIASHGYSGLKKLVFGSVAYGILHEAHIPVLVVRPEAYAEKRAKVA
jgi:nucleotide-binding universal stress UspA family protein